MKKRTEFITPRESSREVKMSVGSKALHLLLTADYIR